MAASRLRSWSSLMAIIGLVALAPDTALAKSPTQQILTDCTNQPSLVTHYSVAQLRQALQAMTAEEKEYTSCSDVLNRAILAAVSGSHGNGASGGGSGSFLPTPVLVILILLGLSAVSFGALAIRRRRPPEA